MRDSFGKTNIYPRKLPGGSVNNALAIRDDLLREFPPIVQRMREAAKVIAFKVGNTPRSVEGHRQQEQLPSLAVGLAYGKMYPEVRALLMRLMDANMGDSGDSPAKVLNEIAKLMQGRVG